MKFIVCETRKEAAVLAAEEIISLVQQKPDAVLGLATGSSPIATYDKMTEAFCGGEVSFSKVRTFNLDEYWPQKADAETSYHAFMYENLFDRIDICRENVHILDGETENPQLECKNYEKAIEEAGGIDLQLLGLGRNGHIGFNEPGCSLSADTHLQELTENTRNANARFFESRTEVPSKALTMGMGTIMRAKKIVLVTFGRDKHKAVQALLDDRITTEVPVTLLKLHPDVTIICDRDAYEDMIVGVDIGGTYTKIGLVSSNGSFIDKLAVRTPLVSAEELLDVVAKNVKSLMEKYTVSGLGVSMPGLIDKENGVARTTYNLPLSGVNVAKSLREKTGLPVFLDNDASCAALGELMARSEEKVRNMVYVSLGTGVGGGIVIDGKLYRGSDNSGAEIGHMCIHPGGRKCGCGERGCLEAYASVRALILDAQRRRREDDILPAEITGASMILEAEKNGSDSAREAVEAFLSDLVLGIDNIKRIFAPDVIVVGGGITEAPGFGERLQKKCAGTRLEISRLKNDAGMLGAAELCRRGLIANDSE